MNITIIGTGYVGLVAGVCFAEMGHKVICLDIDKNKLDQLSSGKIPIYEPGLEELLQRNRRENRIFFTDNYRQAVIASTLIFLALPTPSHRDGSMDISQLLIATEEIVKYMNDYTLIVNKSTAPVGTLLTLRDHMQALLSRGGSSTPFDLAVNPEFMKEGNAIQDFLKPDRIIIGSNSLRAKELLSKLYSDFTLSRDRIIHMDIQAAELTKYVANAMLSCRISFMNEIAAICSALHINVQDIRRGIGSDSRIGSAFLYAGVGFGGSCFPKDLQALIVTAKENQISPHMLEAIKEVNISQKNLPYTKLIDIFSSQGGLRDKVIAIWGLSFKPDTDDMREAPSLTLIESLLESDAIIQLFDPVAMPNATKTLPDTRNIIFCSSERESAYNADAICLLTEWKQFRSLNMKKIIYSMRGRVFIDGRNQYDPEEMEMLGFAYFGVGSRSVIPNSAEKPPQKALIY